MHQLCPTSPFCWKEGAKLWVRQRRGEVSADNAVNSSDYIPALREVKVGSGSERSTGMEQA